MCITDLFQKLCEVALTTWPGGKDIIIHVPCKDKCSSLTTKLIGCISVDRRCPYQFLQKGLMMKYCGHLHICRGIPSVEVYATPYSQSNCAAFCLREHAYHKGTKELKSQLSMFFLNMHHTVIHRFCS